MPSGPHIHVRQLEIGDFEFVRELAAKQANFTVPPPYVLWLLLRIKDAVCLVAEHSSDGPLAYLLAVPVEAPSKALFVWQLAVSKSDAHSQAMTALVSEIHLISRRLRISTVAFSAVPGSPQYRAIRQCIRRIAATSPEARAVLPLVVSRNETEYQVRLRTKNT